METWASRTLWRRPSAYVELDDCRDSFAGAAIAGAECPQARKADAESETNQEPTEDRRGATDGPTADGARPRSAQHACLVEAVGIEATSVHLTQTIL